MKRLTTILAGVFFLSVGAALAQQAQTPPPQSLPAASQSEADCSGFISGKRIPPDLFILDGADNDFHSPMRVFSPGDDVFLHSTTGANAAVGTEYAIVRPAKQLFEIPAYDAQHWSIRTLGVPYEDVGRIKVTHVTARGPVAQVTASCSGMFRGDIAVPYQPRTIPEYTPTAEFDPFAEPNGKIMGAITAAKDNAAVIAQRSIVYLNLGQEDGVQVGQRFRVFRLVRDRMEGIYIYPDTPRESTGELIILSTQERSSVGIIVRSLREIFVGDGVQLE